MSSCTGALREPGLSLLVVEWGESAGINRHEERDENA